MTEVCIFPFKTIEITENGNVYGCGAGYMLGYSFGNIFDEPFNEIWNSEKAQKFRQQFFDKDYKYCNFEKCTRKKCGEMSAPLAGLCRSEGSGEAFAERGSGEAERGVKYPVRVQLHIGRELPSIAPSPLAGEVSAYADEGGYIKTILPILQNAKLVNINTPDNFFENEAAKELVKAIIEKYPNIKFAYNTTGVNLDEEHMKEYDVWDRTAHVILTVSPEKKN